MYDTNWPQVRHVLGVTCMCFHVHVAMPVFHVVCTLVWLHVIHTFNHMQVSLADAVLLFYKCVAHVCCSLVTIRR